jgi:4-amino-4-deoxy-L-arabinose transferase-like glycosyltransferase
LGQTRYIHSVRETVRQHFRFFALTSLAALALRLLFLFRFPAITEDSLIYGDIARNWLQHGIYGITDAGRVVPTFIRLPGYPAFLAVVFSIFGVGHYKAALVLQIFVDLGTCFVIADMTRRVASTRAAKAAFLLATLCPFFANYAAAALTETLEIFFTVLALDFALVGLENLSFGAMRFWVGCGLAVGAAILLRPDGGLLLMAIGLYLIALLVWPGRTRTTTAQNRPQVLRAGLIVGMLALAPLVPWTWRNWHTLHQFQPLAPRYATQGSEFAPAGFNRWVKTWMADYVSVEEIYWAVPGDTIDPSKLPSRAFDSAEQRKRTLQLFADYNRELHITPAMDQQFATLAAERIRDAPLRYYVWLPLVRIADMWLRPRTELLPSDTRWWEFNDDPKWSALAIGLGVAGLGYAVGALIGMIRARFSLLLGLLYTFVVLRSFFLGTLENPEPRYMLECYFLVILLSAIALKGG